MPLPTDRTAEPLAIIGMACRLPGAENLEQYWQLISEGRSAIGEAPADRFDQRLYYDPQKGVRGKSYSKLAAVLTDRTFDPGSCPVPSELLATVDRTHLLMTQVAADAVRHAGLDPFQLAPTNTAVFIGHAQGSSRLGELTYRAYIEEASRLLDEVDGFRELSPADQEAVRRGLVERVRQRLPEQPSNGRNLYCNMVSGTVAKAFGLTGGWLALNSACASSLHAMLLGARALQLGRADMVIVGGASDCKNDSLVLFSAAQTLSTCGSRPFDSEADGLVMSEGYVALVMKTLRQALADGDPIQAVVRGLGVASDGRGKSLWAPRKEGQIKAMQRAYRSGIDMATVQYLEAHATSTQVGDATELETLGEVLGPKFPAGKKIPITSVKANIGHTLEAAGVAGVIKAVLCMQHRVLPPAINIRQLNSKVDWSTAPYYIPMKPEPWQPQPDGSARRAAVNAFGIGGMNMHVVLDEYTDAARELVRQPARPAASPDDRAVAIVGIGCVLPGASGADSFWQSLSQGVDPKSAPPESRWTREAIRSEADRGVKTRAGFITDFQYDWRKHKVPPKQVAEADPLQFMLLEGAEQALADAGYGQKPLNRETCGVVVGTEFGGEFCDHLEMGLRLPEMQDHLAGMLQEHNVQQATIERINADFAERLLKKWPSLVDETGSFTSSTLSSRITKTLDLAGGAVSIDSGSTSAMSALSVAIDMLLSGDNDLMICAAGQRRMGPNIFDVLQSSGLMASGEARHLLDANYDGIVPAEGVGVVVLKRLADARRDGDRIHAVIRGLGLAHHDSPAEALRLAAERSFAAAGVSPADLKVVELDTDERLAPGGDELRALLTTYSAPQRTEPVVLGSSTSQVGHLGGASGMVALIKSSLEVERGVAAPAMAIKTNNSVLNGAGSAAKVAAREERIAGRRFGAVACWSKGLACHVVLEEGTPAAAASRRVEKTPRPIAAATNANGHAAAAKVKVGAADGSWRICRLAAGSPEQFDSVIAHSATNAGAAWRSSSPAFSPDDQRRMAIVADSEQTLARKLQLARPQYTNPAARQVLEQQGIFYRVLPVVRPRVAFIFPGQGSQYDGMFAELVRRSPPAARQLEECDRAMRRLNYPTFAELAWKTPTQLGNDVWSTQVAMLLADVVALAAVRSLGIEADLVLGHSYGEFVALYAAGVWDLETAIRMTRARCDGIVAVARGDSGMLATNAPADQLDALMASIGRMLYVANANAPDQTVVGGKRAQLEALATALEAKNFQARILSVPAAFHTPLMAGGSRLLEHQLQAATLRAPTTAMVSTVTNAHVHDVAEVRRNLSMQLTTPVRYSQLIEHLAAEQPTVFVEVGPQQTMTRLNRRILDASADLIACDNPKRPGLDPLMSVQALLECLGVPAAAQLAQSRASSATPIVYQASQKEPFKNNPMHEQIPHYDATERRRSKKRAGAGPSGARPAAEAAPTPRAPESVQRLAETARATPPTARTLPNPKLKPSVVQPKPPAAAPTSKTAAVPIAPRIAQPHSAGTNGTAPAPLTPQPAAAKAKTASAPARSSQELESFLINFVVEQTGYPAEVVDLDADLEADLGVDSIKKAQLFGELQEYFDVASDSTGNLSLDEFPTLRHVLAFLMNSGSPGAGSAAASTASPAPAAAATPASSATPATPPASRPAQDTSPLPATPTRSAAELESFLINFVVEQTGYPAEVVDLDADLEADLGVDSIKKAQLFGELQEYFDIGSAGATNLSLDDFPTLRHVLNFLLAAEPSGSPTATAPQPTTSPAQSALTREAASPSMTPAAAVSTPGAAELESFLINFVVEQTGYPAEVVDLDADLEADLGVDSIKKAQLFGELQEYFDVGGGGAGSNLSLDDFPTLRHVMNFLLAANAGDSANVARGSQQSAATSDPAPAVAAQSHDAPDAPSATNSQSPDSNVVDSAQLGSFLINFVVEQTGYPAEVVDLDADLEADLGVDSIKKAQLFGELQEYFDIEGKGTTNLSLDDFPTLRHVLDFLRANGTSNRANAATEQLLASPETNGHAVSLEPPRTSTNAKAAAGDVRPATPYDAGWQRGTQRKNVIRESLYSYVDHASTGDDGNFGHDRTFSCDELDALAGIADASGVAIENLIAYCSAARRSHSGASSNGTANNGKHFNGASRAPVEHHALAAVSTSWSLAETSSSATLAGVEPHDAQPAWHDLDSLLAAATFRCDQPLEVVAPSLPSSAIATRFVMEMADAPLAKGPREPQWHGAAVILGEDSLADTLHARLEDAGVTVYRLSQLSDHEEVLGQLTSILANEPAPHLFITSARGDAAGDVGREDDWSRATRETIELPFVICQRWVESAVAGGWLDRASLVAVTALGGDFGFQRGAQIPLGGALAGLLKAIFIEYRIMQQAGGLQIKVIDAPFEDDDQLLTANIFRELASTNPAYEVSYVGMRRRVPVAVAKEVGSSRRGTIRRGANWVVTGGARGITAACALELAKQFGLRLNLLGSSSLPQVDPAWLDLGEGELQKLKADVMIKARQRGEGAAQAWDRVQKDLEIARSLRTFAAAGVEATYYACDVSDRNALEATLDDIRLANGPVEGVLHGAGIDRSCRFDRKQSDVVRKTIGAKVDGAAHLMALTRRDPIRHFIGFGSISGRFGSFGQTDYAIASDMLCKLIGKYRRQRPWIHAVGIHWHPWDEVGMAARPETKNILQGKSDLTLMPLAEGICHLVREIAGGADRTEVLITERRHWQRFAEGLQGLTVGRAEPTRSKSDDDRPVAAAALVTASALKLPQGVELRTHRCHFRMLSAPLDTSASSLPSLDGTAWVVGDNDAAIALRDRLIALGCPTVSIMPTSGIDKALSDIEARWSAAPARHLFLMTGRDKVSSDLLDEREAASRREQAILFPFFVAQRWYKLLSARPELGRGTLAAAVSLGGDFGFGGNAAVPDGGALDGLLKAVFIEDSRRDESRLCVKVVDAAADEPASSIADAMLRELAGGQPEVEVAWSQGQRRVVRPLPATLTGQYARALPKGGTWIVTGGGRGITAIAARELAKRHGWKLHLIGKSPPPIADAPWRGYDEAQMKQLKTTIARAAVAEGRSPSEAWDRVTKDVEIFNNLQSLHSQGIAVTYHSCDVGDRQALAKVLAAVRRQDGPIEGVLHGAGIIDPSRFESKRRDLVTAQVRTKFDGTLNLMALTAQDPLKYFAGFGSISGRFGGNGLADYAAGNDAMAKLIDWFRGVRPDCSSGCIHWESWEGAGMATVPRYAFGPRAVMNMKYMLPEEGVCRLEHELLTGFSDSEVLYTFGDFYPMFYPLEQRPLGEFVPAAIAAPIEPADTSSQFPLLENIRQAEGATVAHISLDPAVEPFLIQHRLRNKPLLPVVVGLESLAECAAAASGLPVRMFRSVEMLDGLHFHTDRPVVVEVRAVPVSSGALDCRLTCDFRNRAGELVQKARPYLQATVELSTSDDTDISLSVPSEPRSWTDFAYPDGSPVYHGPAFRGVVATAFDRSGGWGRIRSLPLDNLVGAKRAARWTIPSVVLDAALYACGIHLWMHGDCAISLPRAISSLTLGRHARPGEMCLVYFACHEIAADRATYDFTVIGEDRSLIVAARDYRKVILARGGAR